MSTLKEAVFRGILAIAILVSVVTLTTACGSEIAGSTLKSSGPEATAAAVAASQAKEQQIELAEELVRNGKYDLPGIGTIQLKDGNYQEKYGEGATQVKRVGVATVAFGDIDGDKIEDAAVVLWSNTGGSGTFIYLATVLNKDGKGQQAGAQMLGDRVQIESVTVNSGKIDVVLLAQGSGDSMVSPSLQSEQDYGLQDGKLVKFTPAGSIATPASRPTQQPNPQPKPAAPSGLIGTIWIWQRFVDNGEKGSFVVPYPAAYRLELLSDGKFLFQADCNTGSGGYTLEGSRLALSSGPTTLAECQPGSRYRQFAEMISQVTTYALKGDALYLNLKMDSGDLVFGKLNAVTGKIEGPAGDTAPAGSTAEVLLMNKAGDKIGGSLVKAQLPMQFEAPFNSANIDPSANYMLQVTIKDAQKNVIYRNSRPYQVLTQGNPTYHLVVVVERAQ